MEPSSAPRRDGQETSHFSVIDADGNRVSATVTVNLRFGSGLIPAGTGVIVNDEMDDFAASVTASNAFGLIGSSANEIQPGKRPVSTMSPSFVDGPKGVMVIGTPGGSRILTMVALGILDFVRGGDATHIVGLPRYHMQYLPDVVEYEPAAFDRDQHDALMAMGYALQETKGRYGNMQVVIWRRAVSSDGLEAASDPRGVGAAVVEPVSEKSKSATSPKM
jgi:gamma-glutamyltranspeptidase/glutathione hydrolase